LFAVTGTEFLLDDHEAVSVHALFTEETQRGDPIEMVRDG
jgi:hypothetical protein